MSHYLNKKIAILIGVIVLVSGCAPTSKVVKNHAYSADLHGLELTPSYLPTVVYLRPGAARFEAYNRFIVDPVMINYDDPSMKDLDPEAIARMQTYFRDSLITSLREGGYTVGTRTEPDTLRISFHLSGLKAPNAAANISNVVLPFVISVGEVTVEAQFREAVSNRLDIVAVANTQGARLGNAKPWSTWADVESAFDQWVNGIRKEIDSAHNK